MRLTPMIFRNVAAILLLAGSLAHAVTITGTVTDKTTGKPAVGDVVVLVNPMAGMSEVAQTTTDARGHYSLQKAGEGPALLRAKHQGAEYFIEAPHGAGPADIAVYDVAAKVDGVGIDEDVIGVVETTGGQLRVVERYALHNSSAPPRTQWTARSFEVVLPEGAVVEGVSGQRPGGLPTTVKLDPAGPKGHYSFNFPIEPDAGEKGTLFQIEYTLPYSGKLTFHPQVTIPAKTVWVMMPKSMNFAAGAGSVFQSSPQDPGFLTYVSRDALPGKALEFTLSGNGALPRDDQGGQGGQQAGSGMGAQGGDAADTSTQGSQVESRPGGGLGPPVNGTNPIEGKYTWWILGGLALLMVAAAGFLLRKPVPGAAMNAGVTQPVMAPVEKSAALLNALKEELFALESEKIAGTLAADEYEKVKTALETVLRRALKKKGTRD
ncbi:MAG: carboxypeptidase regulatory-like domain-containing protein [Terracidiphilus sp.]